MRVWHLIAVLGSAALLETALSFVGSGYGLGALLYTVPMAVMLALDALMLRPLANFALREIRNRESGREPATARAVVMMVCALGIAMADAVLIGADGMRDLFGRDIEWLWWGWVLSTGGGSILLIVYAGTSLGCVNWLPPRSAGFARAVGLPGTGHPADLAGRVWHLPYAIPGCALAVVALGIRFLAWIAIPGIGA